MRDFTVRTFLSLRDADIAGLITFMAPAVLFAMFLRQCRMEDIKKELQETQLEQQDQEFLQGQ